jgi:signal transduction histidine kinase
MYSCIILWKELNQTRPKEYLLKIGMFLSLIGLFNDASLGSGYFYYGFPLSFLGALFESIRFTNYFQYKAYSRLNVLQDEVTKVAKAAHVGLAAGSIAHDIRNPLTIIFGNLQVIKSKIKTENLSFDLEKFLKRIEISTERIENIVSTYTNLLYHNKQEELKEYNLKELIEASIANCEYRVKSSSLSIFEEINPDLFLKCNKTEVIMTVSNLIVNACDATKDLESPWVRITNRMVDGQFAIEVTDSGSGIPEDIVHKIFEPQFTTKKQGEGTGLGLNIIRELISRRKWDIVVDKNSSNTCFQVLIPVSFISENPNKLMNQKSS